MNFRQLTTNKKVILLLTTLLLIINFVVLVYALVYASPDSAYKKNALLIGIIFLMISGFARNLYNSTKE